MNSRAPEPWGPHAHVSETVYRRTTPATPRPKTFANAAPALHSGIARRRAIDFPSLDAIVWMSPSNQDVLVYRL
ncbi:hypothetical protein VZQ01_02055 [Myxococcus faecalis]|uniref:hypothetical protein n=1 Tax=Myxococcus faecalis TaxID=3115646 RepID=UPI003CEF05F5